MLLVTQRVVSASGQQGTNAFLYRHGAVLWTEPQSPDILPRTLVRSHVEVTPAGNRVLSYLDICVPDDWTVATIDKLVQAALAAKATLPDVFTQGVALVRFDLDRALATVWRSEVSDLYRVVHDLALYSGEVRVA